MVTTDQFSGQFFSIPMYDDGNHNDMNPETMFMEEAFHFKSKGDKYAITSVLSILMRLFWNLEQLKRTFFIIQSDWEVFLTQR